MKRVSVKRSRLDRFKFTEVENVKQSLETRPELEEQLKRDFEGTLKAEGVKVDADLKKKIRATWDEQVKADLRGIAASKPQAKNWYLTRVLDGKPLKIHVKIKSKGGRHIITKGDDK